MELLESQWFLRMVESAGKSPIDKLVAVFSVTKNWIAAPGIRDLIARDYPSERPRLHACGELKHHLTGFAASARARHPAILASQLVILLQGAIAEEMRNPGAGALDEAARAARAVIAKACELDRRQRWLNRSLGGLAASAVLAAAASFHPLAHDLLHPAAAPRAVALLHAPSPAALLPTGFSPGEMAEILALQRQIEEGHCPAPQLLAMPQGQVTAYMNAVKFRTPDNPAADRENMRAFLAWFRQTRATECYFSPHNGHTAVTWVTR